jgi:hypothetical protein
MEGKICPLMSMGWLANPNCNQGNEKAPVETVSHMNNLPKCKKEGCVFWADVGDSHGCSLANI